MSSEEPLEDCTYGDPLVEKLVSFIAEEKFQRQFELFFLQHCRKFEQGGEHSLEYTKIYQEFEIMFQSRLQEFCEREKVTKTEFYKRCKATQTTDIKASHYLNIMLSSVDYPQFVDLMRVMRKLHGDRLDRQDRNAEGVAQLDGMLAGAKKKKKGSNKRDSKAGDDEKEEDADFKASPSSRAEGKEVDDDEEPSCRERAESKDAK